MSDENPVFRPGEESLRWVYVVRATASHTDSVHLRSSSCSVEFIFETADSLLDSLVVQDVPVGYARGVSPLSYDARYSRAPGVGVKVDTASTIDVVRLLRLGGDRVRVELGDPANDTLIGERAYSHRGTSMQHYYGVWDCPTTQPLARHSALVAEGYQAGVLDDGTWSLQVNHLPVRATPLER
jgi:hypothetical protein